MTNAADELHALYSSWRQRFQSGSSSITPRRALRPMEPEGLTEIVSAFRLLARLDELIGRFERIDARTKVYREQYAGWARVPLMLNSSWGSGTQPDNVVSTETLNQILAFSLFLEGKVLTNHDVGTPAFRALIEQANAALSEDHDLPQHMVAYLRRLLSEIQFALDDKARGRGFDFHSAAEHLWAGLEAAAGMTKSDKVGATLRHLADQTLVGFASGMSGAIGGSLMTLALTM